MTNMIGIQVGQCGNQVGLAFWTELFKEHGIGPNGMVEGEEKSGADNKDVFFYQADNGRYVPRAVCMDLEPRVLQSLKQQDYGNLYNPENFYVSSHGGGAGNAWASGYYQGGEAKEAFLDILQREAENADALEGFMLTHSIGGGTGAGLGSRSLEILADNFNRKLIQTYSVFPVEGESNVVVEPYNAVLTLSRLVEYTNLVTVIDNKALNQIAGTLGANKLSFPVLNGLIARIMCAASAPVRYYSSIYPKFRHIFTSLARHPPLHFVEPAYFPFVLPGNPCRALKTTPSDVLTRLLKPSSLMLSAPSSGNEAYKMLSGMAILQGENINYEQLSATALEKSKGLFPAWSGVHLHASICPPPPYQTRDFKVSGLLLANHSRILSVADEITRTYDLLYKKQAYIGQYEKQYGQDFVAEMCTSREKVEIFKNNYRAAMDDDYIQKQFKESVIPKQEQLQHSLEVQ